MLNHVRNFTVKFSWNQLFFGNLKWILSEEWGSVLRLAGVNVKRMER